MFDVSGSVTQRVAYGGLRGVTDSRRDSTQKRQDAGRLAAAAWMAAQKVTSPTQEKETEKTLRRAQLELPHHIQLGNPP